MIPAVEADVYRYRGFGDRVFSVEAFSVDAFGDKGFSHEGFGDRVFSVGAFNVDALVTETWAVKALATESSA